MKTDAASANRAMQAQLDRLASGDLAENERRSLLAWLDEDASRWRGCALAFLEAQTWEAAAGWPAAAAASPPRTQSEPVSRHSRAPWRQILSLAVAAALLFVAGHWSARFWPRVDAQPGVAQPAARPGGPLMASVTV